MLPKYDNGSWVKLRGRQGQVQGYCGSHEVLVRWVGENQATVCDDRKVKACAPPRALVLEGSLDRPLHSTRSEEAVLRTWLAAHGVDLAYKNIHMLEDIDVIGRAIGQNRPVFVHISCHGSLTEDDEQRPYITFAPKPSKEDFIYLDMPETIEVFKRNFSGLPVLFSACLVGKYQTKMTEFKKLAGLKQVAAFTREVEDSEAILFELLVYHGILASRFTFRKSIEKASAALKVVGVKGDKGRSQTLARVF